MSFAEQMREQTTKTYTENGAAARNTSGDARLDLFASIGSLRSADPERIELLFAEAYQADPLFALKILFYARDIREGLGERRVFRMLLQYLAKYHPQDVIENLDLIGVYGRFDDWYCLVGTRVEDEMWKAMKQQLEADLKNFQEGKSVSLLAKWIKTADSKREETRKLGILTAQKLGYPVYNFKRIVRSLRKYIGVLEVKMSEGKWEEIVYPEVSGRAMMIYRNAFLRHDMERFDRYLMNALEGKEKIHAETLYPYDLVEKILYFNPWDEVMEAQWLFNVPSSKVTVVVQPQSIIHSMVEFIDGGIMAQLGSPDMRLPIQYALYYPHRRELNTKRVDFFELGNITFEKPDMDTFKGLKLAYTASDKGGNIPTAFNAANELAVAKFLDRKIKYLDIPDIIEYAMNEVRYIDNPSVDEILETEQTVYEMIENRLKNGGAEWL